MGGVLDQLFAGLTAGERGFGIALAALVTVVLLWWARRTLGRARLLEDTPTSLVRSAAQGYCELAGRALNLPGGTVRAPLTGSACTWWHYAVHEKVKRGKNSSWQVVEQEISDALFALDDHTGRCVVDPDGADVIPSTKVVWYGDGPRPLVGPQHGARWAFGQRYRYTERRIDERAELLAIGFFETRADPYTGEDVDREVALKLAEWKRNPGHLKARFDADGDGQVDLQEWEAARAAARAEVEAQLAARALTPGVNLMRAPRGDPRPFILSTLPQEALVRRQRWQAAVALSLAALALWVLVRLLAAQGR
jgi:hypothetical protein